MLDPKAVVGVVATYAETMSAFGDADLALGPIAADTWIERFGEWDFLSLDAVILWTMLTLRLSGIMRPHVAGAVRLKESTVEHAAEMRQWIRTQTSIRFSEFEVDLDLAAEISKWWQTCESQIGRKAVPALSLQRFALAFDRPSIHDSLLDLVIALEALLIRGQDTNELNYRASLRAALLCHFGDETAGLAMFDLVKTAYAQRSRLAHGAQPTTRVRVGSSPARSVELTEFVEEVDDAVRRCMACWFEQMDAFGPNGPPEDYWTRRALGNQTSADRTTDEPRQSWLRRWLRRGNSKRR